MADYNIYIHDSTTAGGNDSQVKPWTTTDNSSKTKAWTKEAQQEEKDITSLSPSLASVRGATAAAKANPYIAAAIAVVGITYKAVQVITPMVTRLTGDYAYQQKIDNFSKGVQFLLNPFGFIMNVWNSYDSMIVFNQKQEQERILIGESKKKREWY